MAMTDRHPSYNPHNQRSSNMAHTTHLTVSASSPKPRGRACRADDHAEPAAREYRVLGAVGV